MIPHIIHQTWKTNKFPPIFRRYQKTWIDLHPDWEYRFYDDEACRQLIKRHFSDLLSIYDNYSSAIQRADMFRYLVIFKYGGLYADMDMECYKNMSPLLKDRHCVFGVEEILSPGMTRLLNLKHSERIANCIFAAEKSHPVFSRIIEQLIDNAKSPQLSNEIIGNTGPGMLTDVVQQYRHRYNIHVLPQICWIPPTQPNYPNCFPFNLHMYAKHHFAGTWKTTPHESGAKTKIDDGRHIGISRNGLRKIMERGLDIRGIYYKLPPSPIWKEDLKRLLRHRS